MKKAELLKILNEWVGESDACKIMANTPCIINKKLKTGWEKDILSYLIEQRKQQSLISLFSNNIDESKRLDIGLHLGKVARKTGCWEVFDYIHKYYSKSPSSTFIRILDRMIYSPLSCFLFEDNEKLNKAKMITSLRRFPKTREDQYPMLMVEYIEQDIFDDFIDLVKKLPSWQREYWLRHFSNEQ